MVTTPKTTGMKLNSRFMMNVFTFYPILLVTPEGVITPSGVFKLNSQTDER